MLILLSVGPEGDNAFARRSCIRFAEAGDRFWVI